MGGRGGSSHRTSAGRTSSAFDFLRRAYGENHANAVLAILQNAPEHIRSMWDDFSGQFRSTSLSRNARSAFYAPADDSVHLNISRVARGDVISTPYSVLFHEYGHMPDYLIARSEVRKAMEDTVPIRRCFRELTQAGMPSCIAAPLVGFWAELQRTSLRDIFHVSAGMNPI